MSKPTILSSHFVQNAALVPPPAVSLGLGPAVLLVDSDATGLYDQPGSRLVFTTTAAIDASTPLTAQQKIWAKAMLSQRYRPAEIIVAAYDTGLSPTPETVTDALNRLLDAGLWVGGTICSEEVDNATLSAIATWLGAAAGTGNAPRSLYWLGCLQSSNADLLTDGFPAALSDLESVDLLLTYHEDDTEPVSAAMAGAYAGYPLALQGPAGIRGKLSGIALPVVDQADVTELVDNNTSVLLPLDAASPATQRILGASVNTTAATNAKVWITQMWVARVLRDGVKTAIDQQASQLFPIDAGPRGQTLLRGFLAPGLAGLADRGYFTPGTWAPNTPDEENFPAGYDVTTSSFDGNPIVSVRYLVDREAQTITINQTGQIL